MVEIPEYDPCEDCMGSGGHRDYNGDGSCFACGGKGRIPSNKEAVLLENERETSRTEAIWQQARSDANEGYQDYEDYEETDEVFSAPEYWSPRFKGDE